MLREGFLGISMCLTMKVLKKPSGDHFSFLRTERFHACTILRVSIFIFLRVCLCNSLTAFSPANSVNIHLRLRGDGVLRDAFWAGVDRHCGMQAVFLRSLRRVGRHRECPVLELLCITSSASSSDIFFRYEIASLLKCDFPLPCGGGSSV